VADSSVGRCACRPRPTTKPFTVCNEQLDHSGKNYDIRVYSCSVDYKPLAVTLRSRVDIYARQSPTYGHNP